jgi:hypothetical protein
MVPVGNAPILGYNQPPRPPWLERLEAATLPYSWYLFRRKVDWLEVAIAGPVLSTVCFQWHHRTLWERTWPLGDRVPLALVCVGGLMTAVAVVALALRRRWRALAYWAVVSVAVLLLGGGVSYDRCPHARYLIVFGRVYVLSGERCGNPRDITPLVARWVELFEP